MSNYIVDGADLASVANAIRTKGGTSAQLAFPAGFVSAIDAIPTGGGGLTNAQFEAIANLFRLAVYNDDPSEAYAEFIAAFSNNLIYQVGDTLTVNGGVAVTQSDDTLTLI